MVTRYARMRPTLGAQKATAKCDYDDDGDGERAQNATGAIAGENDLLMQMNPTRYLSKQFSATRPSFQHGWSIIGNFSVLSIFLLEAEAIESLEMR